MITMNYVMGNSQEFILYVFETSAPHSFGEKWAQGQLESLVPALRKPLRKLGAEYSGQYNFILEVESNIIRIKVKALRAVDASSQKFGEEETGFFCKRSGKNLVSHLPTPDY